MINRSSFLGVLLAVIVSCGPKENTSNISPRFNHVFLTVADLDRSIEFYTKALDLKVTSRLSALNRIADDGTKTKVDVNMAFLKFPSQDFVLEIGQREAFAANNTSPSYAHLGIDVIDIEKAATQLLSAGAIELRPIGLVETDDVSAKTAFFLGPDGETIELMQIIEGVF